VYIVYTTNQLLTTFDQGGGGGPLVEVTVKIVKKKILKTFVPITSKNSVSVQKVHKQIEILIQTD
jgi:hypothetical protein